MQNDEIFFISRKKNKKEKHCKWVAEREKEVISLRNQLLKKEVPADKHDISDERRRNDATWKVKKYWENKQSKSGKINGRTIADVLGGEKIIKVRDWLIKKIDDELKLAK